MSKDSTLYAGSFEINSSKDEMYHFANGYIDIEQGHVKAYCYYVKDHLGNVRHVDMANPRTNRNEIVQVNNYYPFGGIIDEGARRGVDVQNHLYNGKELDRMHGLNLYDYSARQYDPSLGRMSIYTINNADDKSVSFYFDKQWETGTRSTATEKKAATDPTAKVVDKYCLWSNNCTTKSIDAINSGKKMRLFLLNKQL